MLSLINQFVYRPDATFSPPDSNPAELGLTFEDVSIQTADGVTLSAWYLPAAGAKHTLMYCHGNAGGIGDWMHAAPPFVQSGVTLLIWDYRGYGRSEGQPSEEGLYLDGEAVWAWLKTRADAEGLPASILGKSLGSAVAIHVAAKTAHGEDGPDSLILDSAFTSMREVVITIATASGVWLPKSTVPKLFESLDRVHEVSCPTLVIHGGNDTLVPLAQGRHLYEKLAAQKSMKVIQPAGHNDISAYPEYHSSILTFLTQPANFTTLT
jgi:fermentation-respiration switch protein FrsA (DUF1100 family)